MGEKFPRFLWMRSKELMGSRWSKYSKWVLGIVLGLGLSTGTSLAQRNFPRLQGVPAQTVEPPLADAVAPNDGQGSKPQPLPQNILQQESIDATVVLPTASPTTAQPVPRIDKADLLPPVFPSPTSAPTPPSTPAWTRTASSSWSDPPVPYVTLHVRVPAYSATDRELTYRLIVHNPTQAAAHQVIVRNAIPSNARFERSFPEPTAVDPDLQWKLGTLEPGATKEITLVLLPKPGATSVKNCARVSFEHGQCVVTELNRPTLKLVKSAPSQAVLYDAIPMKLEITNPTKIEAQEVQVSETLPEGLEFERELTALETKTVAGRIPSTIDLANNRQIWTIGRLGPGQKVSIPYRILAKKTGPLTIKTLLRAERVYDESSTTINILEAKLGMKFNAPREAYVNQPASYEVVLQNLGNATLNNIRVTQALPPDAQPTKVSHQGQVYRDQVQWIIARLEPGESKTLGLVLTAPTIGKRKTQVAIRADRGLEQKAEAETDFIGVSAVRWRTTVEPGTVKVGEEMTYQVVVESTGSATASNLQLKVHYPDDLLEFQTANPVHRLVPGLVQFDGLPLQPKQTATYIVKLRAKARGEARVRFELTGDPVRSGGPLHSEKLTTIIGDSPPAGP